MVSSISISSTIGINSNNKCSNWISTIFVAIILFSLSAQPAKACVACGGTCPFGSYCISASCTSCPAGYGCANCGIVACAVGTYQPNTGQMGCLSCPSGKTCSSTGMTAPDPCPAGSYCPTGTSSPIICHAGNYCPVNSGSPTQCPAGRYRSNTGGTNLASCTVCSAGHYCVSGSASETNCAAGRFRATTGGTSAASCGLCSAGHYCPAGASSETNCAAGSWRGGTGGTSQGSCSTCSAGHYCVSGSTSETNCPAGSYRSGTGGTSLGSCTTCSAGHYCASGATSETNCAAGSFRSTTGGTSQGTCSTCTSGHYCPSGAVNPTDCAAGTWRGGTGGTSPASCSACSSGNYCPAGSSSETPCPAGRYRSSTGGTSVPSCSLCTLGHYCPQESVNPTQCGTGRYRDSTGGTNLASCDLCPSGTSSSATAATTAAACGLCSKGNYQPSQGQASCLAAAPGYYVNSTGATSQTMCDYHHYSDSSASENCTFCGHGRRTYERGADSQALCMTMTNAMSDSFSATVSSSQSSSTSQSSSESKPSPSLSASQPETSSLSDPETESATQTVSPAQSISSTHSASLSSSPSASTSMSKQALSLSQSLSQSDPSPSDKQGMTKSLTNPVVGEDAETRVIKLSLPMTDTMVTVGSGLKVVFGTTTTSMPMVRVSILLASLYCGEQLDELSFPANPTRMTIGQGEYRWWKGVVVGDGIILMSFFFIGGGIVLAVTRTRFLRNSDSSNNNDKSGGQQQNVDPEDTAQLEEIRLESKQKHLSLQAGVIEKIGILWLMFSPFIICGSYSSLIYAFETDGAAINLPFGFILAHIPVAVPIWAAWKASKLMEVVPIDKKEKESGEIDLAGDLGLEKEDDEEPNYCMQRLSWIFGSWKNVDWTVKKPRDNDDREGINLEQLLSRDHDEMVSSESNEKSSTDEQQEATEEFAEKWGSLFNASDSILYLYLDALSNFFISLSAGLMQNPNASESFCQASAIFTLICHIPPTLLVCWKRPLLSRFDLAIAIVIWICSSATSLVVVLSIFDSESEVLQGALDWLSVSLGVMAMIAGLGDLSRFAFNYFEKRRQKNRKTNVIKNESDQRQEFMIDWSGLTSAANDHTKNKKNTKDDDDAFEMLLRQLEDSSSISNEVDAHGESISDLVSKFSTLASSDKPNSNKENDNTATAPAPATPTTTTSSRSNKCNHHNLCHIDSESGVIPDGTASEKELEDMINKNGERAAAGEDGKLGAAQNEELEARRKEMASFLSSRR